MRSPPTIVGASAGSGKTYRLTQEVTRSIAPGATTPARIEGLVAVTYTRKAQAELASRIRRTLVEHGAFDQAARLPVAYLGTVHAVCMRLLEELALDAGLSPYPEVMPEDGGRRMRAAIQEALPPTLIDQLEELARRLQIFWDERVRRHDWPRRVMDVMELARGNRIPADGLAAMGRRSVASYLALLPQAGDGAALDAAFDAELEAAIGVLAVSSDGTKATAGALKTLREIRDRRTQGEVQWTDWPRASKIEPSVKCRAAVAPLVEIALRCDEHPALHEDVRAFTLGLFDAARLALSGYADWKARRRVVDYADMIDQALRLVEDPDVAAELADRLDLVVVDEFQDTSPLQLALFTRLHGLAGRSVWVGDGKQCIFEYAGADPLLMDAVIDWVTRQGGPAERLERNYRSRPELVDACSDLFARAFAPLGWSPDAVRTVAARATPPALAATAPVGGWWLEGKGAEEQAEAIAEATARLLAGEHGVAVLDRLTGEVRPAEARDIGILAATNREAQALAGALQRRGVRASLPREGLMQCPEAVLVDAGLRWVLERGDRRSLATLEALGGWNGADPDAWLAARLSASAITPPAWLDPLAGMRAQLDTLSPAEALDRVIHLLDAATLCARWPDPAQRLGNLDALRAHALRFEDRCARLREPATIAGLIRYFAETQIKARVGDEERASDDQFSGAVDDAVTVCTYHRAKGLEWPVVVLTSLDRQERRTAFDPCPESEWAGFNPEDPLGGRWIRFWPWPFGRQTKVPLAEAVASSPEGRRVAERERRERVRLLYVGFTRARDHLVLAARSTSKGAQTAWLDDLQDGAGAPLLTLPIAGADGADAFARFGEHTVRCRVARPVGDAVAAAPAAAPRRLARAAAQVATAPRYRITPSQHDAAGAGRRYAIDRLRTIGPPIKLGGSADWEALGTAVHAFLAVDRPEDGAVRRHARASRIVERAGFGAVLDPAALVGTADQLVAWVDQRWPGARWNREVPITALIETAHGRRRIEGVIDLLLTVPAGVVIVDHKTYPAPSVRAVADRAAAFLPQLAAYAEALEALGHHVVGACLHFPIGGIWADLRPA